MNQNPLSRRRFLRSLGTAAIAAAIGSACRPARTAEETTVEATPPPVRTATPEPIWEEGGAPLDEQTLYFVKEGSLGRGHIPGLDCERDIGIWVYTPLFLADEEGKLIPLLADGYDANRDQTAFTFYLNKQAVWSDGRPITAPDCVAWWNFIFHPYHQDWPANYVMGPVQGFQAYTAGEAERIEGVEALDDFTLHFALSRSEGWFPFRYATAFSAPARVEDYEHVIQAERNGPLEEDRKWAPFYQTWERAAELIVSGPYRPVTLQPEPDAFYEYELNPKWWRQRPTLTRLEGTTLRDFARMRQLFEEGRADVLWQLTGPEAVRLQERQPEAFHPLKVQAYWAIYFDTQVPPLDDIHLRKALLHAIEWDRLPEEAWEGQAVASHAGSIYPPDMPCFDPQHQPYPFDPEKAQAYLAQSPYGPGGEEMPQINILTGGSDPPRIRATEIIQACWQEHLGLEGVVVRNTTEEFGEGAGPVAMRVASGGALYPVPATLLEQNAHSMGSGSRMFTHAAFDEMDDEIEDLLAMQPDDPTYCAELQRLLQEVDGMATTVVMAYVQAAMQLQPWLHNCKKSHLSGVYTLPEMWKEKEI